MFILLFSREYAAIIPKSFAVKYNPYSQRVEVLDTVNQISSFATDIRSKITFLL